MATLAAQVTPTGILVPSYADILQQLKNMVWSIYGSDVDLDADTQDGQMLSIFAQAIADANEMAAAVYNSFPPTFAQGAALSSVVKINGIARQAASASTAIVTITGVAGVVITAGLVGDDLGLETQWALPDSVTIPGGGTINVTATCTVVGNTTMGAGHLTVILTPTRNWQAVTNAAAATPGNPVESDAALRVRQGKSVAIPAQTVLDAIFGAIANLAGVGRLAIYENDTDTTDGNGIPSHSISPVVEGGDINQIAAAIANKKTPGTGTFGTTTVTVFDSRSMPNPISFFSLTGVPITVEVTIHSLTGYVSSTGVAIQQAVSDYINALSIGEDSFLTKLYTPANLTDPAIVDTFVVTLIKQSRTGPVAPANVVIAFNEAASCNPGLVTVIVV